MLAQPLTAQNPQGGFSAPYNLIRHIVKTTTMVNHQQANAQDQFIARIFNLCQWASTFVYENQRQAPHRSTAHVPLTAASKYPNKVTEYLQSCPQFSLAQLQTGK